MASYPPCITTSRSMLKSAPGCECTCNARCTLQNTDATLHAEVYRTFYFDATALLAPKVATANS